MLFGGALSVSILMSSDSPVRDALLTFISVDLKMTRIKINDSIDRVLVVVPGISYKSFVNTAKRIFTIVNLAKLQRKFGTIILFDQDSFKIKLQVLISLLCTIVMSFSSSFLENGIMYIKFVGISINGFSL